ncbi:MAG: hypothetical protein V4581_13380 [Bacteroidota bacterium]
MKKMYFLAMLVFTALAVQAQTVTKEQLQGKWRMVSFSDENGSADVLNGTWKINDKPTMPKNEVESQYKSIVEQTKDALLKIEGNTASQIVLGEEFKGQFTLEDKNGKTYMTMDEERGMSSKPQIYIEKGQMHIIDNEIKAHLVYNMVK